MIFIDFLKMYHKEGLPIEDFKIDARPCYCMKTTMHISDCEENCIFYSNGNTESHMSQLILVQDIIRCFHIYLAPCIYEYDSYEWNTRRHRQQYPEHEVFSIIVKSLL